MCKIKTNKQNQASFNKTYSSATLLSNYRLLIIISIIIFFKCKTLNVTRLKTIINIK